jgi:predicted ester cyclase
MDLRRILMSEENKAIMRLWFDMYTTGDVNIADEIFAPSWLDHATGRSKNVADVKANVWRARAAFPDVQVTIEDMVAEGDKIAVRYSWTGTHRGEFMGIAPTGKKISWASCTVRRIVDGKIIEHWMLGDNLGLLKQLGVETIPH